MLGSEILEIAIGVVFTFVLLSLTATTVRESIEAVLKTRAIQLERGLRQMLDDPAGTGITKQLFDHPLLYGLFAGNYNPGTQLTGFIVPRKTTVVAGDDATSATVQKGIVVAGDDATSATVQKRIVVVADAATSATVQKRIRFRSNLPAYIPSRNFALALLDLASTKSGSAALSLDGVRQTAVTLQNERLRQALLVAISEAEGDIDRARTSLEAWFDGTMDRVSGWYKRETQWVLLALGLFLAVALNVDCLHVARSLALSNTLRQKIVQSGEDVQRKAPSAATGTLTASKDEDPAGSATAPIPAMTVPQSEVDAQLSGLSDIIGWQQFYNAVSEEVKKAHPPTAKPSHDGTPTSAQSADDDNDWYWSFAWRVVCSIPGWLISALAVSLGAPFWFDVLNKLMVVRSTVKPYQKSPSEGSDDRKSGLNAANLLAPNPAKAVDTGVGGVQPVAQAADGQTATVAIRLAFETGVGAATGLRLVVDGGEPQDVPPDSQLEINVTANVPHTLNATAKAAGGDIAWSGSFIPSLDDDGWPMLATLT